MLLWLICYTSYCCRLQSVQNRDVTRTNIKENSIDIAEIQEIVHYTTLTSTDTLHIKQTIEPELNSDSD